MQWLVYIYQMAGNKEENKIQWIYHQMSLLKNMMDLNFTNMCIGMDGFLMLIVFPGIDSY